MIFYIFSPYLNICDQTYCSDTRFLTEKWSRSSQWTQLTVSFALKTSVKSHNATQCFKFLLHIRMWLCACKTVAVVIKVTGSSTHSLSALKFLIGSFTVVRQHKSAKEHHLTGWWVKRLKALKERRMTPVQFSQILDKCDKDIFVTTWMTKEAPLKSGLSSSFAPSDEFSQGKLAIMAPAATASNGKADKANHGRSVFKMELI